MNNYYQKILTLAHIPRLIKILLIIGMNWVFQSILYMDRSERVFKIFFELIMLVPILIYLVLFQHLTFTVSIIGSIFIAHTMNWTFNGNFFALIKTFNSLNTSEETILNYIEHIKNKTIDVEYILSVYVIGSFSRDELTKSSDLDLRIIRNTGFINSLKACIFMLLIRSRAFLSIFPLDIYLLDNYKKLEMHNKNELTIIINNKIE